MILRAPPEDGAEYRLRNRKGPCAHGLEESGVRPPGLFARVRAMLRSVMHRRHHGTRGSTVPLPEPHDKVGAQDAMGMQPEGERAFVCRVRPVGARGPLNFRR